MSKRFLKYGMMRNLIQFVLFVTTVAAVAGAQSQPPPLDTGGKLPRVAFGPDTTDENQLQFGVRAGGGYDDDVVTRDGSRQGDFIYLLRPSIHVIKSRDRVLWSFFESPGLILRKNYSQRDQFQNDLSGGFQYRATPHLTLQLREGFFVFTHPDFLGAGPQSFVPELNLVDQPAAVTINPEGTYLSTHTTLGVSYELSSRSSAEVSGVFYYLNVSKLALAPGNPVIPKFLTQTSEGRAAYLYRLTPNQTVGVMYLFQGILFNGDHISRTLGSTVYYFHTIAFKRGLSVQFFAGPERVTGTNKGQLELGDSPIPLPSSTHWITPAGGASFIMQSSDTNFRATFRRQVRDGGGVLPASIGNDTSLFLRRRLSSSWAVNLTADYGDASLTKPSGIGQRVFVGGAAIAHQFGENFWLHFHYMRQQEHFHGIASSALNTNRNVGLITLEYVFSHLLGR
jgi:hypothetical protein